MFPDPLDEDSLAFRKRALRDSIVFMASMDTITIIFLGIAYWLVNQSCKNDGVCYAIQIMMLALMPPTVLRGILLLVGAVKENLMALEVGYWLHLLISVFFSIIQVMAGIYFIVNGYAAMHYIVAAIFLLSATTVFCVIFNDLRIIQTYKRVIMSI